MRQIRTKKFKEFLKAHGLVHLRTRGDHEIWNKPNDPYSRPITFIGKEKEIPLFHIKTNLKTMGIGLDYFLSFLDTNR